jgi:hypothetical protein
MAEDYSAEILNLEQLVNAATASVSADGLSTSFDLDKAKKRLAELYRLQGETTMVRPRIVRVRLGGNW